MATTFNDHTRTEILNRLRRAIARTDPLPVDLGVQALSRSLAEVKSDLAWLNEHCQCWDPSAIHRWTELRIEERRLEEALNVLLLTGARR